MENDFILLQLILCIRERLRPMGGTGFEVVNSRIFMEK